MLQKIVKPEVSVNRAASRSVNSISSQDPTAICSIPPAYRCMPMGAPTNRMAVKNNHQ